MPQRLPSSIANTELLLWVRIPPSPLILGFGKPYNVPEAFVLKESGIFFVPLLFRRSHKIPKLRCGFCWGAKSKVLWHSLAALTAPIAPHRGPATGL